MLRVTYAGKRGLDDVLEVKGVSTVLAALSWIVRCNTRSSKVMPQPRTRMTSDSIRSWLGSHKHLGLNTDAGPCADFKIMCHEPKAFWPNCSRVAPENPSGPELGVQSRAASALKADRVFSDIKTTHQKI